MIKALLVFENGIRVRCQIRHRDYKKVFMGQGKLPFFKKLRYSIFGVPKPKKTMVKKAKK